jgi:hypothetical protein
VPILFDEREVLMRFSGFTPITPHNIQLKSLPAKAYPKATAAEVKALASANAAAAAIKTQAMKGIGFGETYLPSISKLTPDERPFVLAAAKSIKNDPAQAATIKFSDEDGKKVASLDQYIADLQSAIDGGFSGVA